MRARLLGAWSLAAALGTVNVACGATRTIPPEPLAADPGHPAPFTRQWLTRAGQGWVGPVAMEGGLLLGAGYDRRVVAVRLSDGKEVWDHRMAGGGAGGVQVRSDTVYAASDRPTGEVIALGGRKGSGIWRQRRTGRVAMPLLVTDSSVIVAPVGGGVLALGSADGEVRWRRPLRPAVAGPINGAPGEILVTTGDSIFRLDVTDGRVRGGIPSPVPLSAPWVTVDSGLILPGGNGVVAELTNPGLAVRWRDTLDSPILIRPTVAGDTVWVATQSGSVYQILRHAPTPSRLFHVPSPIAAPPLSWRGLILVGMADGTLRAVDSTGAERWRIAVGSPLYTAPIPMPDGLIVLGGRGDIHRFVGSR